MALSLHVDVEKWRAHLSAVMQRNPGLVPVVKGNGYGFGLARLAAEAQRLGVDTIAVGMRSEADVVRSHFAGDIVVMEPWHPNLPSSRGEADPRIVRTLAHPEAVRAHVRTNHHVVVELRTSMNRHGLLPPVEVDSLRSRGFALHLPIVDDRVAEAERVLREVDTAGAVVWVSHVMDDKLAKLQRKFPSASFRPRIGTALWLGDRSAFSVRSIVLDVHPFTRGDHAGYRQGMALRNGHLLVLAGGTSHGIGLEAPKPVGSVISSGKVLAAGALAAGGLTLSPFTIDGKQRWFHEPPHMQVSLVVLPDDAATPSIGDEVGVDVRMTTATFDRVVGF